MFWCDASSSNRLGALLEQSNLQILGAIDNLAVHGKPAVGNAEHQLCAHHALHVDVVHNLADVRQHLARELQFAKTERAAAPLAADPAQIETDHLPHRVEAETAR